MKETSTNDILLVSSSGGVLLDLLALQPWWSQHKVIWAVVKAADTESLLADPTPYWIHDSSIRDPWNLMAGFGQAWHILQRHRPALIVSAGSAPAIPFFLIARFIGIPTFWLTTLNLLTTAGLSARICARLASRVLLQRPSMHQAHPDGIVIGELY